MVARCRGVLTLSQERLIAGIKDARLVQKTLKARHGPCGCVQGRHESRPLRIIQQEQAAVGQHLGCPSLVSSLHIDNIFIASGQKQAV